MPSDASSDLATFFEVFREEAEVITARRLAIARGELAQDRGHGPETPTEVDEDALRVVVEERVVGTPSGLICLRDERGRRVPQPNAGHNLTGLSLSGGGIRSASFCLGALQGLDAIREDHEPQVLDQIDYLSTVSGGGYVGTSFVSGVMQAQGRFPFTNKLDQEETLETQHLRDYSNFLMPNGAQDLVIGLIVVLRGLLINAMIFLGIILMAAGVTARMNPTSADLAFPAFLPRSWHWTLFFWTSSVGATFLIVQAGFVVIASRRRSWRADLRGREHVARIFFWFVMLLAGVAFFEAQAYVLQGLFQASADAVRQAGDRNLVAGVLLGLGGLIKVTWPGLVPAVGVLAGSAGKLMAIFQSTKGDPTWNGYAKWVTSVVALGLLSAIVPLLIWSTYLLASYWGIFDTAQAANCRAWLDRVHAWEPALTPVVVCSHTHLQAPEWLRWIVALLDIGYARLYTGTACVLLFFSLLVSPNAGSLHAYYRDRLSRAFLWSLEELRREARRLDGPHHRGGGLVGFLQRTFIRPKAFDVDEYKFSSLKKRLETLPGWDPDVRFAPYLLVNTAVNLEGSKYLNRRGRNADNFIFSPLFMGSEATRYARSGAMETADPHINLGTAMAASGAAASANMGASTIKALTFSLAALNVRLGYWLPNPRYAWGWRTRKPFGATVGPWYFTKETFGWIEETTANVYVTDGGHFDNLGLYELLKRRCKVVVAVDAEADPLMNFDSLVRIQRYARIDMGVRIDLPWEPLRRSALAVTGDKPHGPLEAGRRCRGPHVAAGRILYGEKEEGVLIYVKASMSGDESDLIRDYKRRQKDFPDETTTNQFFTEEQFEVYRALAFHATQRFFSGKDRFGTLDPDENPDWLGDLDAALRHLNVSRAARTRIVSRAAKQTDGLSA